MDHLIYCVQEILIINELLRIKNSSFYKRNLSRLIAVRVDDFIRISFAVNKSGHNLKIIKNEVNALQDLYKEFLKLQRDKYGAHFQDLEFFEKLQFWSQIDYDKSSFFSSMPVSIYNQFSSHTGFISIESIFKEIDPILKDQIQKLNETMDIEKYPNLSSDLLSLTRYNSGGILNFSKIHYKASTLKSLELIIDYNIELYLLVKDHSSLTDAIKKLLVLDIVSYCDNFITRTDLAIGAPQDEQGLDEYLTQDETPVAFKILNDFKLNSHFQRNLDIIRTTRDIICGHIDNSIPLEDLKASLASLQFDKIQSLYVLIKKTFRQMCRQEFLLNIHLLEPENSKLHGTMQIQGMSIIPFDSDSVSKTFFQENNFNSYSEYNRFFKLLNLPEKYEEARRYFWDCFERSTLLLKISTQKYRGTGIIDFRLVHQYFKEKLLDTAASDAEKLQIFELFKNCRSGHPNTLSYILEEVYPIIKKSRQLKIESKIALGDLLREREKNAFKILKDYNNRDFYDTYHSNVSIFKIDVKSRQWLTMEINTEQSEYSNHIKNIINKSSDPFTKLIYSIAFSSELAYNTDLSLFRNSLKNLYNDFFTNTFRKVLIQYLDPFVRNSQDRKLIQNIMRHYAVNRFATVIGILSDFLEKCNQITASKSFRKMLSDGIIKFAENDNTETHNYGVVNFKLGKIEKAVLVAEHLVNVNPTNKDYYHSLLSIYLSNEIYNEKFEEVKKWVLNNLSLTAEEEQDFLNLRYAK